MCLLVQDTQHSTLNSKETLNHCPRVRIHGLEARETTQARCLSHFAQRFPKHLKRPQPSLPRISFTAAKFGRSFGVAVCSAYWMTPFLSMTKAARAAVSPMPASPGKTTS